MTTVEQAAQDAAYLYSKERDNGLFLETAQAFKSGYLAGHAAARAESETEISALKQDCQTLEWSRAEEVAVRMSVEANNESLRAKLAAMREPIWMLREEHEAAMAELRSRLEAAEARAVRWVSNEEAQAMMSDADGGRAYADIDACPQREIVCLAPMIPQPPMMPGDAERADAWRERYVANVMAAPVPLPETEP